jgi:hypothetical protein
MAIRPDRPNRYDASLGKSTMSIWTVTNRAGRIGVRDRYRQIAMGVVDHGARDAVGHGERLHKVGVRQIPIAEFAHAADGNALQASNGVISVCGVADHGGHAADRVRECIPFSASKRIEFLGQRKERIAENRGFALHLTGNRVIPHVQRVWTRRRQECLRHLLATEAASVCLLPLSNWRSGDYRVATCLNLPVPSFPRHVVCGRHSHGVICLRFLFPQYP